ncbi:MAG: carbon monoxide dehydrogenase subunit G [Firmicutes bacterium]|nr:carbon monoxide dehydrogenase subunit G [Bacillota bacterium]
MELSGQIFIPLSKERVWQALNDPAVLEKATPGCRELRPAGADRYQAVVELGIAAVKGRYEGTLEIAERQPPDRYRLRLAGSGGPGFVEAELEVALEEGEGGTTVRYTGQAQVGGPIAAVGQRVLGGVAKLIMGDFFKALAREAAAAASTAPQSQPQPPKS